jgi:hypothetical protein
VPLRGKTGGYTLASDHARSRSSGGSAMGLVLHVPGREAASVLAYIDTGALSNWVSEDWLAEKAPHVRVMTDDRGAHAVDGRRVEVSGYCEMNVQMFGHIFKLVPFRVMRHLPSRMLLGRRWLAETVGMVLDLGSGTAEFEVGGKLVKEKLQPWIAEGTDAMSEGVSAVIEDAEVDAEIMSMDFSNFSQEKELQEALRDAIWQRREVFKGTGRIRCAPHVIRITEGTAPICEPLRRRSPQELDVEREAMQKLPSSGIMEHSTSPWATHNVFVKKKDGRIRTTTDFRRLNSVTMADPMEDMGAAIEWLAERKIFTVLDLKHGFFQIGLDAESRAFTAVRTCL